MDPEFNALVCTFFFNSVILFLCRAVNNCYRILVEHGQAYREWAWGIDPQDQNIPLKVLRAATELLRYFTTTPESSAFLARLTWRVEECGEEVEFARMQRDLQLEEAATEADRRAQELERQYAELQARHRDLEHAVREGEGRVNSLRGESHHLRGVLTALRHPLEAFVGRLLADPRLPGRFCRGAQRMQTLLARHFNE